MMEKKSRINVFLIRCAIRFLILQNRRAKYSGFVTESVMYAELLRVFPAPIATNLAWYFTSDESLERESSGSIPWCLVPFSFSNIEWVPGSPVLNGGHVYRTAYFIRRILLKCAGYCKQFKSLFRGVVKPRDRG